MTKRARTAFEVVRGRRYSLGYDAIDGTIRRRSPQKKTAAEITALSASGRDCASATARDDRRNMSLLAWMVRRHLDNVSRFTPHFRLGESPDLQAVNNAVARLLRWHGRRSQFDALRRHGRNEWLRMFEATKIIDGDCGGLKAKGGRLQGIEGSRIRKPTGAQAKQDAKIAKRIEAVTDEGVTLNPDDSVNEYCVCRRDKTTLVFEQLIPAADLLFDGYWPERFDSNRGVSPLLTALNEAADVRETWQWLILKAKTTALMGLMFNRTGSDEMLPTMGDPATEAPATETASYAAQLAAAVKARSIISMDLDQGETVTEVGSNTPNPTVIPFTRELIRSVLLALDIPFTFYDSLTASFSARIADRNEYEESCEWKREKNQDVLAEIYAWLFPIWATADLFGFGSALKAAKIDPLEAAAALRWVPAGRPWLDRANEMSGHILALAAGVTSTPRICAAYGDDAYVIAREQAAYLEAAGAPLLYAQGGQIAVQAIMAGMGQQPAQDAPPDNSADAAE